ncbi:MAG: hypothetical protein ACAI25_00170, partial [Planctomycetota bacterium]
MRRAVAAIVALLLLLVFCSLSAWLFSSSVKELESGEPTPIGALRTIHNAQTLFREGKPGAKGAGRYATLVELRGANLLGKRLGSGTKYGYLFEARPSVTTSEFLWFATARPTNLEAGTRAFFTNQTGVVHYRSVEKPEDLGPVVIDADTAAVPSG